MVENVLTYATAEVPGPSVPNWATRVGMARCIVGYSAHSLAILLERRWPAFAYWVPTAATLMLLGGCLFGLIAIGIGHRRAQAVAVLLFQIVALIGFFLATFQGPGN